MASPDINELARTRLARFDDLGAIMWRNEENSDLTLKCNGGGKEFKVHKLVVCSQSKPLAAAINGKWKESESAVYEFFDEDEETVEILVDFLYKQDYILGPSSEVPNEEILGITKVYILADKYDIDALKNLAVYHFEAAITKLEGASPNDWSDKSLHKAMRLIYEETSSTDRDLKFAATNFVATKPEILYQPIFQELLTEIGEIGLHVARALTRRIETPEAQKPKLSTPWDGICIHCTGDYFEYEPDNKEIVCRTCGGIAPVALVQSEE